MATFDPIPDEVRTIMAQNEPVIKAALFQIANIGFDTKHDQPSGIWKYGGGIKVNGRDIAIYRDHLQDDDPNGPRKRGAEVTPEERVTLEAINYVTLLVQNFGIYALEAMYGECYEGNPLSEFTGCAEPTIQPAP